MPSITAALGYGSGIDTAALVADLAAASRAPKIARLDELANRAQTRISALAQARSDLASFATSLSDIVAGGTLRSQPTVSDPTAVSASASPGARLGSFSAELIVTQLARGQTVHAAPVVSATDPVGQGTMTLSIGGVDHAIVIDSSNDSLNGLAAAINATGAGVTASIVRDGATHRLVLKGATGAANGFTLTGGPAAFSYPGGMTQAQAAQDAAFTIDGIGFTRATNSVVDIFPGIALTLKKAQPGVAITIGAERPSTAIRQTLIDFVAVFNTLKADIKAAREANGGDSGLRALDRQLAELVGKSVTTGSAIDSLSDIGITTTRDGTITLDSAKLEAALAADPDAVEAIFNPLRDANHDTTSDPGIALALKTIETGATGTNGVLDALKARLDRDVATLGKDRERIETREAAYRLRLERQFGAMDARIGALKATQAYLEQQIKLWTADR